MNFFKSVFSDDPDPQSESTISDPNNPNPPPPEPSPSSTPSSGGGAWNFGGLIKTLTSKSESIIETYRRDLQEFGTGLKKEIEVAQGSLDEFGNTVAKETAHIISKGKDAILAVDLDSDSDRNKNSIGSGNNQNNSSGGYYSRFDAAVRAVQGDASTYCDEPEDFEEFEKWKRGFSIDGKSEEMEKLLKENEAMESVYRSVVPNRVDHEGFWFRYYYKVYRIKKAEDLRARLVKGMEKEDDEDWSWDVEEEDDDDDGNGVVGGEENVGKRVDTELRVGGSGMGNEEGTKKLNVEKGLKVEKRDSLLEKSKELGDKIDKSDKGSKVEELEAVDGNKEIEGDSVDEMSKLGVDNAVSKNADSAIKLSEKEITEETEVDNAVSKNDSAVESDEKVIKERKGDDVKSSDRKNESSMVNADKDEDDEEDIEWDEIEDLSSIDETEKKTTQSGSTSTSKAELRMRLSAAEEEEDLSWDIEEDDDDDDDNPTKA